MPPRPPVAGCPRIFLAPHMVFRLLTRTARAGILHTPTYKEITVLETTCAGRTWDISLLIRHRFNVIGHFPFCDTRSDEPVRGQTIMPTWVAEEQRWSKLSEPVPRPAEFPWQETLARMDV